MLKILVVGSFDVSAPEHAKFAVFCRALGACLSDRHKILVAGTTLRTADNAVVWGALDNLKKRKAAIQNTPRITLYHTNGDESQMADTDLLDQFENDNDPVTHLIPFDKTTTDMRYGPAFQKAVADCDVVTLIGGSENSEQIVGIAISHQKPVLGFTTFGGAGEKANIELQRVYQLMGISDAQTAILKKSEFTPKIAEAYLDLVETAHEKNPWAGKRVLANVALLVGVLALLVGAWGFSVWQTYEHNPFLDKDHFGWFFACCILAGTIGSYIWFVRDLRSPRDVVLWRALPRTGRGVIVGLSVAGFTQMIIGMIYHGDVAVPDLSFTPLVYLCSLITWVVAAFGFSALKILDDVLGKVPLFDKA